MIQHRSTCNIGRGTWLESDSPESPVLNCRRWRVIADNGAPRLVSLSGKINESLAVSSRLLPITGKLLNSDVKCAFPAPLFKLTDLELTEQFLLHPAVSV